MHNQNLTQQNLPAVTAGRMDSNECILLVPNVVQNCAIIVPKLCRLGAANKAISAILMRVEEFEKLWHHFGTICC